MDAFCWSSPPPAQLTTANLVLSLVEATPAAVRYATPHGAITLTAQPARVGAIDCALTAHAFEAVATISELAARTSQLLALAITCASPALAAAARQAGFARTAGATWTASCDDLIAWHHVRQVAAATAQVAIDGDDARIRVLASDGVPLEIAIEGDGDERFVSAVSPICREDLFAPRESLAHTDSLVVGALAVRDDQLALRYGCSAGGFTATCLQLLLREAARLRALIAPPVIHTDAFACAL